MGTSRLPTENQRLSTLRKRLNHPTATLPAALPAAAPAVPQCFEGRIQACRAHFKGQTATYNCAGFCGLCELCGTEQTVNVGECLTYCTAGVAKCTETCEKGRAHCLACGV